MSTRDARHKRTDRGEIVHPDARAEAAAHIVRERQGRVDIVVRFRDQGPAAQTSENVSCISPFFIDRTAQ
ncbi:hypothetical protein ACVBGC_18865 [Burkholderia stagnalis]